MKLISFELEGKVKFGAFEDNMIYDLHDFRFTRFTISMIYALYDLFDF